MDKERKGDGKGVCILGKDKATEARGKLSLKRRKGVILRTRGYGETILFFFSQLDFAVRCSLVSLDQFQWRGGGQKPDYSQLRNK